MKTLAREGDRSEIVRRLGLVRPDSVRRWGRMSAHQMVCHLADWSRMALGQRAVSPATGVLQRTLLKVVVLYVPLPWPSGIRTSAEVDQERGGTRPVDFAAARPKGHPTEAARACGWRPAWTTHLRKTL